MEIHFPGSKHLIFRMSDTYGDALGETHLSNNKCDSNSNHTKFEIFSGHISLVTMVPRLAIARLKPAQVFELRRTKFLLFNVQSADREMFRFPLNVFLSKNLHNQDTVIGITKTPVAERKK